MTDQERAAWDYYDPAEPDPLVIAGDEIMALRASVKRTRRRALLLAAGLRRKLCIAEWGYQLSLDVSDQLGADKVRWRHACLCACRLAEKWRRMHDVAVRPARELCKQGMQVCHRCDDLDCCDNFSEAAKQKKRADQAEAERDEWRRRAEEAESLLVGLAPYVSAWRKSDPAEYGLPERWRERIAAIRAAERRAKKGAKP